MPRAIWSGTISFGLVSIPVKLFNAVSRKSVSFNQLDARTGARVRQKLVSGTDGSDVPRERDRQGLQPRRRAVRRRSPTTSWRC